MKVIFKRALLFRGQGKKQFHVHASNEPQDTPDWVRTNSAFQLCISSGVAIEVRPPAESVKQAEAPKGKTDSAKDKSDSDGADGDDADKKDDSKGKTDDADSKAKAAKK